MTRLLWAAAIAGIVAGEAWGQAPPCGPHADVAAALKEKHRETPISQATTLNGSMLEVFVSPKGTWTIVMTGPNGAACLMAAGTDWEALAAIGEDS